jgi:hypothetical protein
MTINREEWLQRLVKKIRPWYEGELPETIHLSIGFSSKGIRSKTIGECWHKKASADEAPQVFIHPKLSNPIEVAAVVVHELIHACRPDAKHGKEFKQVAVRLGLEGRMTATSASSDLKEKLGAIVEKIGPFPHPALTDGKFSSGPKQSTRLLKVSCPDCGYLVRTTQKWLEIGLPLCPDGAMMEVR